jgi:DNA-binding MarR family transcriptional regulator
MGSDPNTCLGVTRGSTGSDPIAPVQRGQTPFVVLTQHPERHIVQALNNSMAERSKKSVALGAPEVLKWIESGYRLSGRIEAALEVHGLSLAKLNVLTHLAEARRSLALSEIAEKLQCVRSNVTQMIDRLESEGLVRRLADPSDRRTVRAELTELGFEKQGQGAQAVARAGKEVGERLSTEDLAALSRLSAALE